MAGYVRVFNYNALVSLMIIICMFCKKFIYADSDGTSFYELARVLTVSGSGFDCDREKLVFTMNISFCDILMMGLNLGDTFPF